MGHHHLVDGVMDMPTPGEAVLARAALTPDAIALLADGEPWTCHRLAIESARLTDAFRTLEVRQGDRVAIHMSNRVEVALAYLACWHVGAIAVPVNTRYKSAELIGLFDVVRPVLYLGEAELYPNVAPIAADLLSVDTRFVVGVDHPADHARPWKELTNAATPDDGQAFRHPSATDPDAPAVLLSTSGTTGHSKLVVWTFRTLANFSACSAERGLGGDDRFALFTPMMHASGAYSIFASFLTGAVAVLLTRFDPDAVLDAIEAQSCTAFFGLPFACSAIAAKQQDRPRNLSSLRVCLTGGDVCLPDVEEVFASAVGRPLLSIWAATEDTSCTAPASRPGPFTRSMSETEVRLVDEAGASVTEGAIGEMLVRSPGTTPGYWLEPGRIDPLPGGWFHSGDLMRREPDGQLRFMGRAKDLIVRGGSNVSPVEVEDALRRQPGVVDAAVAGLPDPELGERVGAILVLAEGTTEGAVPDILAGLRSELSDYKVPERTVVVSAIPRNIMNKVDRHAIAETILPQAAPADAR